MARENCVTLTVRDTQLMINIIKTLRSNVTTVKFDPGLRHGHTVSLGGTRVRLGVGVLKHQRWTGFSRRSLLGYLHNYRSGVFQNRED
ncbi:uncharacterized protein BDCG_17000 [Blastomyces dermatitidis ER-3]|uniref:Uncharacterized protein n=1 Tax=Ajellomyces dermatitidis (strain ER-3 / ATCC MYA-2586) TaxID=559297 RepID=A0ABX2VWV8_AJEDR|nr:uncharacterized protein BDCG_17000 [Blastomyces dermatitidis ER-3]OAT01248.1 hypothetical protein BDCG_17000 [Blastomyces dermatitidis ER-3]